MNDPSPHAHPNWLMRSMMAFLSLFERWVDLTCRSFTELTSESFERELTRFERLRQAMHRGMCSVCSLHERRQRQLRTLARDSARTSAETPRAQLSTDATERIRQAMRDAGHEDDH